MGAVTYRPGEICFLEIQIIWATQGGQYQLDSFMSKQFERSIPIEYLDLKKINSVIAYNADDVCDEVYSLIKGAAGVYYFETER